MEKKNHLLVLLMDHLLLLIMNFSVEKIQLKYYQNLIIQIRDLGKDQLARLLFSMTPIFQPFIYMVIMLNQLSMMQNQDT